MGKILGRERNIVLSFFSVFRGMAVHTKWTTSRLPLTISFLFFPLVLCLFVELYMSHRHQNPCIGRQKKNSIKNTKYAAWAAGVVAVPAGRDSSRCHYLVNGRISQLALDCVIRLSLGKSYWLTFCKRSNGLIPPPISLTNGVVGRTMFFSRSWVRIPPSTVVKLFFQTFPMSNSKNTLLGIPRKWNRFGYSQVRPYIRPICYSTVSGGGECKKA